VWRLWVKTSEVIPGSWRGYHAKALLYYGRTVSKREMVLYFMSKSSVILYFKVNQTNLKISTSSKTKM
jgi:hypothetical protein